MNTMYEKKYFFTDLLQSINVLVFVLNSLLVLNSPLRFIAFVSLTAFSKNKSLFVALQSTHFTPVIASWFLIS